MKIRVTLEKEDVIGLVLAHLEKSGLNPVAGQEIKYKGALEVTLLIEVHDSARVAQSTSPTPVVMRKDAFVDDGQSIETVLAESKRIQREESTALTRRLAPNEYTEFPRGGES